MKTLKILTTLSIILGMLILASCQKEDESNDTAAFKVKMTAHTSEKSTGEVDTLTLFDEINIQVVAVAIHYGDTSGNGNWMDLPTNAGMYDLLALDSTTVVLANGGELPPGYIGQMRLVLGADNYVLIDSVAYDLQTPSAQQTGLKLNLDFTAEAGKQYEILLDFDASESIVIQGNGGFLLKPVLRVESILEVEP